MSYLLFMVQHETAKTHFKGNITYSNRILLAQSIHLLKLLEFCFFLCILISLKKCCWFGIATLCQIPRFIIFKKKKEQSDKKPEEY